MLGVCRAEIKKSNAKELEIWDQFMSDEFDVQRVLKQMQDLSNDSRKPREQRDSKTCDICKKPGHFKWKCHKMKLKSGAAAVVNSVNLSMPCTCPCCMEQHTFQSKKGETLYKSRLSACPKWLSSWCTDCQPITDAIQAVRIDGVVHDFPGLKPSDVACPVGSVDILCGINYAFLHPVQQAISGDLRLHASHFGTGRILDGHYPGLGCGAVTMNSAA